MVTLYRSLRAGLIALFLILWANAAAAVTIIRDADIEAALRQLAAPLISAAGLNPSQIRIIVIRDPKMNAFVVDSSHIFVNSGLIQRLDSAAELQAVLAHELAHIANGHIVTRSLNTSAARNAAGLGFILALATAAAGGSGDAIAGVAIGSQGAATGALLGHTRAEESSADAASVRYMVLAACTASAIILLIRQLA